MENKETFIIPETYRDIYVVGDIHGEFDTLVFNLTQRYKIRDSVVVIAGDVGLGFEKPGHYKNIYNRLEDRLTESNILLLCIRGNHDDPEYYNGPLRVDTERLKTLPDYTFLMMGNKEILLVGGAVSIDQGWRKEANKEEERKGSQKRLWWDTEGPEVLGELEIGKLPGRLYGIISHEAPVSFLPVFQRPPEIPEGDRVWRDILRSREYLEKLLWRCKPRHWYYGHYHKSHSGGNGVTQYRCLEIQELIRIPIEEDDLLPEEES